ncbi:response regulator [bacterium]|nr:response regulator [bacterium]
MKVLLVEPDKILQKTYANALESSGNIVVRASSAQQALNELQGSNFYTN